MEEIKVKDFIALKEVIVCYIYAIELNDDGTIKKVYYYRYNNDKETITKGWNSRVHYFADSIIKGERIAYAGRISGTGNAEKMNNPSLVTVKTVDGKLFLTTASDDEKTNNLLSLPIINP